MVHELAERASMAEATPLVHDLLLSFCSQFEHFRLATAGDSQEASISMVSPPNTRPRRSDHRPHGPSHPARNDCRQAAPGCRTAPDERARREVSTSRRELYAPMSTRVLRG